MVDQRLLLHWRRERRARERARAALPQAWLNDPRPAMVVVCEAYVEQMTALHLSPKR